MIDRLFTVLRAHASSWARSHSREQQASAHSRASAEEEYVRSEKQAGADGQGPRSSDQVSDDLALFGLSPPSSFEEVRSARNREMQRYHPDRFGHSPEKAEAANEVAQIYNAAFERLKRHFNSQR